MSLPVHAARGPRQWALVWCYETCHKSEMAAERCVVEDTVNHSGGDLVCFKKSPQVGRWLKSRDCRPFVLVAHWREAQPCLLELQKAAAGASLPALALVVLCDDIQQQSRAHTWAFGVSAELVAVALEWHAVARSSIPVNLLGGLIYNCFAPQRLMLAQMCDRLASWVSRPPGDFDIIAPPGLSPCVPCVPGTGKVEFVHGLFDSAKRLQATAAPKRAVHDPIAMDFPHQFLTDDALNDLIADRHSASLSTVGTLSESSNNVLGTSPCFIEYSSELQPWDNHSADGTCTPPSTIGTLVEPDLDDSPCYIEYPSELNFRDDALNGRITDTRSTPSPTMEIPIASNETAGKLPCFIECPGALRPSDIPCESAVGCIVSPPTMSKGLALSGGVRGGHLARLAW
mmetsp:Transcript_95520/g.275806  ORF Transcript_95520/g.275806 Transcript_95520/m.275806 type:complete len:400 (-) Transcript_95520:313-1512(-)